MRVGGLKSRGHHASTRRAWQRSAFPSSFWVWFPVWVLTRPHTRTAPPPLNSARAVSKRTPLRPRQRPHGLRPTSPRRKPASAMRCSRPAVDVVVFAYHIPRGIPIVSGQTRVSALFADASAAVPGIRLTELFR